MGDFSRNSFDRLKHYVSVRLQQGVPIVDADWNEQDDIRRYEVQTFLKWFVGDGVPAGNDGFRIAASPGGGVNTIRLRSAATDPVASSVSVDVVASSAAAALGFTALNSRATRRRAPATLGGMAAQPFALTHGMTLVVAVDGAPPRTVTFSSSSFGIMGAATAAEVAAAVNAAGIGVVASASAGDDFVITGGNGTPETAGRCLAEGRDAVHEGRTTFASQPLHDNAKLAETWGVPPLPKLSAPGSGSRTDLVYVDVWDREVTASEDDSIVDQRIGVESSVRLRREWVVRVSAGNRVGGDKVPVPGDFDYRAGHSYLPLARLVRQPGGAIAQGMVTDLRPRNLLMPPSTLIEDVFGVTAAEYRQGQFRPAIDLRAAINALLVGRVPPSPELVVFPGAGQDLLNSKASVVDAAGGLVAIWESPRVASIPQILAARLDPADVGRGFVPAPAITAGTPHQQPAGVALPNGEILVAYQSPADGGTTEVRMKRASLAGLGGATDQAVAANASGVRAVLAGDLVVFFTHQSGSPGTWSYRRYRHTNNTFVDAAPVVLTSGGVKVRNLHAAGASGMVWVAYLDGDNLQVLRLNPTRSFPSDPALIEFKQAFPTPDPNAGDVFVNAGSATDALVSYPDGSRVVVVQFINGSWFSTPVPSSTSELGPVTVRGADGNIYLITHRGPSASIREIMMRRQVDVAGLWTNPANLVPGTAAHFQHHPVLIPNTGLWLLWTHNVTGDFDVYAKRVITSI